MLSIISKMMNIFLDLFILIFGSRLAADALDPSGHSYAQYAGSCTFGNNCLSNGLVTDADCNNHCPSGTWHNTNGCAGPSYYYFCDNCGPGTYSGSGSDSCTTCAEGKYHNAFSVHSDETKKCSFDCPRGNYCSHDNTNCGRDDRNSILGVDNPNIQTDYICPYDSSLGYHNCISSNCPVACPLGTYRSSTGGRSLSDCSNVDAGALFYY